MRLLLIVLQTNQRHLIPGRSRNARPLSCRVKSCDVDDCEMMDDSVEGGGSFSFSAVRQSLCLG
jgi:hypothetical protein